MSTASVALDETRLLLNDVAAKLYTDTVLIPALNKAYRELRQQFADNGISVEKEQTADITIPTGTTTLTFSSSPALPANLLYPIQIMEKFLGQNDTEYLEMQERQWTPDVTRSSRLQYWNWRQNTMIFPGASGVTVVRLRFWGSLTNITMAADEIGILDSETFLASRTAAIAAVSIGGSLDKARVLNEDAGSSLSTLLSTAVKNRQGLPVRRKPFRRYRFGYGIFWRS